MKYKHPFIPAKLRRVYRRGKRADRYAFLAHIMRNMLDSLYGQIFSAGTHPFLRRCHGKSITPQQWYIDEVIEQDKELQNRYGS